MSIVLAGNLAQAGTWGGENQALVGTSDVMAAQRDKPEKPPEIPESNAGNAPADTLFREWTSDVTVIE